MKFYIQYPHFDNNINDPFSKIAQELIITKFVKFKFQSMWALRSIENDIKEEGGILIINEKFQIETKQFSEDLTRKIKTLIGVAKADGIYE